MDRRISFGAQIWPAPPPSLSAIREQQELALRLLDVGWESIAAKVLSDRAFGIAALKGRGELPDLDWSSQSIVREGIRTANVATAAGCTRRKVKGDVLSALWSPDPVEARARLLGELQSGGDHFEPALRATIGAGLVGCHLQVRRGGVERSRELIPELEEVLGEVEISLEDLREQDLAYWAQVVPAHLKTDFIDLASKLAEAGNDAAR